MFPQFGAEPYATGTGSSTTGTGYVAFGTPLSPSPYFSAIGSSLLESNLRPLKQFLISKRRGRYIRQQRMKSEAGTEAVALIPPGARVAVLGAGAAGLQSARQLVSAGYDTRVYEATDHVGGVWSYSAVTSPTSPLYSSLRCNIPNYAMRFERLPYPPDVPSFAPHRAVNEYLQEYAEDYEILPLISFNNRVLNVYKTRDGLWNVSTMTETRKYNAVFVCTGHFSVPNKLAVEGIEWLAANDVDVQHSLQYKKPDEFQGRRVLVIGAGPSGVDICIEIASVACQVFLSHARPSPVIPTLAPENVTEVGLVSLVLPDGRIQFESGEVVSVDVVMCCTGYIHSYPFLRQGEAGLRVADDRKSVRGLVRHCIALQDPTLCVIGLPEKATPFIIIEEQVAFAIAVLKGNVSSESVARLAEKDERSTVDDRTYHDLANQGFDYVCEMAKLAGRPEVSRSLIEVCRDAEAARRSDPMHYRKREYKILGDGPGMWEVTF